MLGAFNVHLQLCSALIQTSSSIAFSGAIVGTPRFFSVPTLTQVDSTRSCSIYIYQTFDCQGLALIYISSSIHPAHQEYHTRPGPSPAQPSIHPFKFQSFIFIHRGHATPHATTPEAPLRDRGPRAKSTRAPFLVPDCIRLGLNRRHQTRPECPSWPDCAFVPQLIDCLVHQRPTTLTSCSRHLAPDRAIATILIRFDFPFSTSTIRRVRWGIEVVAMKFRNRHSPLLLLLLPSLAVGLSPRAVAATKDDDSKSISSSSYSSSRDADDATAAKVPTGGRHVKPARDAPVDGKDGKPHLGPFVDTDGIAVDANGQKLPPLKGRPDDPTLVDGQKIPKTNDGVMFDKNRDRPEKGISTGTEGGVSEKSKARKEREGKTGEKVLTQPEAPKEQPPMPHSEERKLRGGKDESTDGSKSASHKEPGKTDYTGLDVSYGITLFQFNNLQRQDLKLTKLLLTRSPVTSPTLQTNPNHPHPPQRIRSSPLHRSRRAHPNPKPRFPLKIKTTALSSRSTHGCCHLL